MALAATRLIPMRKNKGKSIGACLHNHTSYIQNPDKTEQGELVSSYQCSPLTVDEEFLLTKRLYEQTTGRSQKSDVIAYQVRQSFKPGEVTPEEANRIGYEFAERFLKGKHAFIVATHTDRAHIHNHIIYNSTALDGTRKFRDFYFSALAVQRLSDLICLEHQLSVIQKKPYRERQKRILYPPKESNRDKLCTVIQSYPEFSEKAIGTITRQDCDAVIRFLEDSDARVYKRAVLKPESKEFKTVSCPKIAKNCTIREETIERIFRGETVSLDSAQQVAMALGKAVEQMFEVEIDRRPMTKKTMREYNLFIRSVLNYANDNYGTSLQMPMIKASGRKGKSVDCLHSDEVEALQAALKECSMLEKAIVLCLLNTGVRRGELAGLTWKDVNFRDGTIHVSKSLLVFPNYGYQLTTTKESNIRDVDVAPEFMAFLKDYHEQWKSRKKLMGASWQKNLEKKGAKYAQSLLDLRGNEFVICNDYGFPINPDSYAALVRRVGKKAGIEKIHPHMFRHTFVSILLSNPNIGVATVAAEAGHAQPSTTLAIYTQVYDRRRDEIRKQMSKELYK